MKSWWKSQRDQQSYLNAQATRHGGHAGSQKKLAASGEWGLVNTDVNAFECSSTEVVKLARDLKHRRYVRERRAVCDSLASRGRAGYTVSTSGGQVVRWLWSRRVR